MSKAQSLKTLIVDDQLTIRALLRAGLKQLGISELLEAVDGEDALRVMLKEPEPPKLIISDFNMPNIDGLQLLRAVRAHPPLSKIAFIMLTGQADRDLVMKAKESGVNNYLIKPFSVETLRAKIEGGGGIASLTVAASRVREKCINIVQGEQAILSDPDAVLSTLLGSCVAACLRDPVAGVGGMNHFLLPGDQFDTGGGGAERHGVHAMELLVNGLLRRGAARSRLEAKLFGGARIMSGLTDIGEKNATFAERFLRAEKISVVGGSLRATGGGGSSSGQSPAVRDRSCSLPPRRKKCTSKRAVAS